MKRLEKIAIIGSSGDIGIALTKILLNLDIKLFLHYNKTSKGIKKFNDKNIKNFSKKIKNKKDCIDVINNAEKTMKGLDAVILLIGGINKLEKWEDLKQKDWDHDIKNNLSIPFFLAQHAYKKLKKAGGRIIFCGTASASFAGGKDSLAYGLSKYCLEFLTKRFAKDGADHNILFNTVAPGFIDSSLHRIKLKKSKLQFSNRIKMIPLKRAGRPDEVASLINFLLSEESSYITGEILKISGGDWL